MDRKALGKKEKVLIHELEVQSKDIRGQFVEQLKCLEQRTETQVALLAEIQDFYKRKAELESEHSRSLDRLVRTLNSRHKTEKQKREPWSQHCMHGVWQQLLEETKLESRHRAAMADLYNHHVTTKLANQSDDIQRIARKCREIGMVAHQQIIRVLSELHTAMKTYQLCYAESSAVEAKFRAVEQHKLKFEENYPKKMSSSRKYRMLEREYDKKYLKFQDFRLKSLKARNEYLLCVDAANSALHKYFAEDLSDLIDCHDLGLQHWLGNLLHTVVSARKTLCQSEMTGLAELSGLAEGLDSRLDKQRFIEGNHSLFMLPRRFDFRAHGNDEIRQVSAQKAVQDELLQRLNQITKRLTDLKIESEEVWKTLETAEMRVIELQTEPKVPLDDLFGSIPQTPNESKRGSCKESEIQVQKRKQDLAETEDFYLEKFQHYLLNGNLINRLAARHDAIRNAFEGKVPANAQLSLMNGSDERHVNGNSPQASNCFVMPNRPASLPYNNRRDSQGSFSADEPSTPSSGGEETVLPGAALINRPPSLPPKPRRKRIGVSYSPSGDQKRPKLFGGSLEEYVEATNEDIPLVIDSCIKMLSQYGLHHQGVFRVSGSQIEINRFKDEFERGDDPLAHVDGSDVNSVAGVLKLYFRELREPLFPVYMFNQFTDCAQHNEKDEFLVEIRPLIKSLSRSVIIVLRYLFGFLNHLSEFSDENMMDPYNLAICFGPTLLPIPEGKDQVFFHNYVNELVKNLIVYHEEIFPQDIEGPFYEKYMISDEAVEEIDSAGLEEDFGDPAGLLNSIINSLPAVDDESDTEKVIDRQPQRLSTRSDQYTLHQQSPALPAPLSAPVMSEKPDWLKRTSLVEQSSMETTDDHYYFSFDPTKRPSTNGNSRSVSKTPSDPRYLLEERSASVNESTNPVMSPTSLHEIQSELKAVLTSLEQLSITHPKSKAPPPPEPDLVQNLPAGQSPGASSSGDSESTMPTAMERPVVAHTRRSPKPLAPKPPKKPVMLTQYKLSPVIGCEIEKL